MRRRQETQNPLYGKLEQMVDAVLGPSSNKAAQSSAYKCNSCGHEWIDSQKVKPKTCPNCREGLCSLC